MSTAIPAFLDGSNGFDLSARSTGLVIGTGRSRQRGLKLRPSLSSPVNAKAGRARLGSGDARHHGGARTEEAVASGGKRRSTGGGEKETGSAGETECKEATTKSKRAEKHTVKEQNKSRRASRRAVSALVSSLSSTVGSAAFRVGPGGVGLGVAEAEL
ncbi:hypothetical protein VTN96DRAFT_637 [Rasamsonia emersonii]